MPRGVPGSKATPKYTPDTSARLYRTERRLEEVRAERDHLLGLVDALRVERERLRQRGKPPCRQGS